MMLMASGRSLTVSDFIDALARSGDAVYVWNPVTDEVDWHSKPAMSAALKGLSQCTTGTDLAARFDSEHMQRRAQWLQRPRTLTGFKAVHFAASGQAPSWVEERLTRIPSTLSEPSLYVGFLRDVSDEYAHQEKLTYLACFDDLTGHFTRARLRNVLAQALVGSFSSEEAFCFAFIGLDNMAGVNHAFGYDVADEVLIGVGNRIKSFLGEDEVIGRVASSKFGVFLSPQCVTDIEQRLAELQANFRDEFIMTGSGPVSVTVSIGAVMLPEQARTTQDAFAAAEDALTAAKLQGQGGFAFHEPNIAEVETRKQNIIIAEELSAALREGRFCLAFQPIVTASDTNVVAFYECLARMVDRDGNLVPAAKFMPVAEQLGFVRLIDRRVLELAFEVLNDAPNLRLSVNLSPLTMSDVGWASSFERLTRDYPEAAKRLIVEITESTALHESKRALDCIARIRERGCSIALDDFGAGYTSFKYFKTLELDIVKIDGSFIRGVCDSPDNQLFVKTLAELGKHYDLMVVAEMVEHDVAAALLRTLGVDTFQGNFFGPAEVMENGPEAHRCCG